MNRLTKFTQFQALANTAAEKLIALTTADGRTSFKGSEVLSEMKRTDRATYDTFKNTYDLWSRYVGLPSAKVARIPGSYEYEAKAAVSRPANSVTSPCPVDGSASEGGVSASADSDVEPQTETRSRRELQLYPLVKEWFITRGLAADITADTKKGGAWGNPDVTAIKTTELFHSITIELSTAEIKLSAGNWKKDIFEAAAHKRFADRTYFGFAHPMEKPVTDSLPRDLLRELQLYSEKYGLGILVIAITPQKYYELEKSDIPVGHSVEFADDDYMVIELFPAVADSPILEEKTRHLTAVLGLRDVKELFAFGEKSEGDTPVEETY